MLWRLPEDGPTANELQRSARRVGIGLHPVVEGAVLFHQLLPSSERDLVLGYVHLTPSLITEGMMRVVESVTH